MVNKTHQRRQPASGQRKSTTSKNSTESDIISRLDKFFIDFENNLRSNNFDKMNTLLVRNIIGKFSKIFQLWDENRVLQSSIGKKNLINVYKSMHNVFNSDFERIYEPVSANDFTLECNHCGEAFPLRNGDCQYSFNVHALSQDHIKFIRNLNTQRDDSTSSHNDALLNDVLLTVDRVVAKQESIDKSITSKLARLSIKSNGVKIVDKPLPGPIIKRTASASCLLTASSKNPKGIRDRQIPSKFVVENTRKWRVKAKQKPAPTTVVEKSAKNHQISSPKGNSISEFDAKCIIFYNNALHCKICGVKLAPKHNIMPHMKGKMHKDRINAGNFMRTTTDGMIKCYICDDYTCKNDDAFVAHCKSSGHLEKVKNSGIQLSSFAVERSKIAKLIQCPIPKCSASLTKFELLMVHFQSIHNIR